MKLRFLYFDRYTQEDYRRRNKDVGCCSYKGVGAASGIDADTNKMSRNISWVQSITYISTYRDITYTSGFSMKIFLIDLKSDKFVWIFVVMIYNPNVIIVPS